MSRGPFAVGELVIYHNIKCTYILQFCKIYKIYHTRYYRRCFVIC